MTQVGIKCVQPSGTHGAFDNFSVKAICDPPVFGRMNRLPQVLQNTHGSPENDALAPLAGWNRRPKNAFERPLAKKP